MSTGSGLGREGERTGLRRGKRLRPEDRPPLGSWVVRGQRRVAGETHLARSDDTSGKPDGKTDEKREEGRVVQETSVGRSHHDDVAGQTAIPLERFSSMVVVSSDLSDGMVGAIPEDSKTDQDHQRETNSTSNVKNLRLMYNQQESTIAREESRGYVSKKIARRSNVHREKDGTNGSVQSEETATKYAQVVTDRWMSPGLKEKQTRLDSVGAKRCRTRTGEGHPSTLQLISNDNGAGTSYVARSPKYLKLDASLASAVKARSTKAVKTVEAACSVSEQRDGEMEVDERSPGPASSTAANSASHTSASGTPACATKALKTVEAACSASEQRDGEMEVDERSPGPASSTAANSAAHTSASGTAVGCPPARRPRPPTTAKHERGSARASSVRTAKTTRFTVVSRLAADMKREDVKKEDPRADTHSGGGDR